MSELSTLAQQASHSLPAAELHGVVCGLGVCLGEALPLQDVVELIGVEALTDEAAVQRFVAAALAELQAEDLSFAPLLPADDAALPARLEALGQWCGSFLAGLAAGLARLQVGSLDNTPEEVREIIRDFSAIAQVEADEQATDDAEAQYAELEEFVKVGALLIMSALRNEADDSPG